VHGVHVCQSTVCSELCAFVVLPNSKTKWLLTLYYSTYDQQQAAPARRGHIYHPSSRFGDLLMNPTAQAMTSADEMLARQLQEEEMGGSRQDDGKEKLMEQLNGALDMVHRVRLLSALRAGKASDRLQKMFDHTTPSCTPQGEICCSRCTVARPYTVTSALVDWFHACACPSARSSSRGRAKALWLSPPELPFFIPRACPAQCDCVSPHLMPSIFHPTLSACMHCLPSVRTQSCRPKRCHYPHWKILKLQRSRSSR
jgi:hypothetical protein